jgi:F-type H+-transporting ATPase subunit b
MMVPNEEIKEGMRCWNVLLYEHNGERVELEKGTALSAPVVEAYQKFQKNLSRVDEHKAEKLEVFKPDAFNNLPWSTLFTLWNFTGLVLFLYTVLGDIAPKVLADYGKKVEEELSLAREAKAESESLKSEHEKMLKELEGQMVELIKKADVEAEAEKKRLIEKAKEDAEKMKQTLEHHIEAEVEAAAERLRSRIAKEAVRMAREEITASDVEDTHKKLVADFILEIKGAKI